MPQALLQIKLHLKGKLISKYLLIKSFYFSFHINTELFFCLGAKVQMH